MARQTEYHGTMRRGISASVAAFGLLVPALLVATGAAQKSGGGGSVTAPVVGNTVGVVGGSAPVVGHTVGVVGAPSIGRGGQSPVIEGRFHSSPGPASPSGHGSHHRHHPHDNGFYGEVYAYPYPVAVPADSDNSAETDDDDDANYQGGPTVFDRRGEGKDDYIPPVQDPPPAHPTQEAGTSASAPQPSTLLVFKDGHTLEVRNYAIVGTTLYDLTPGHPRRIELSALNLDATQEQNDNRGVTFQLPPTAITN